MRKIRATTDLQRVNMSNELVGSRYRLSLSAQRVILALLSSIDRGDREFKTHTIRLIELCDMFAIPHGGQNYEDLRKAAISLVTSPIHIVGTGKASLTTAWLSCASVSEDGLTLELRFDPSLQPYLLELKGNFTKVEIEQVYQLKSVFSFRLYLLLKKHVGWNKVQAGTGFSIEIAVKNIRELLLLGEDKYKLFSDFRKGLIEPAVVEVTRSTNLKIVDVQYLKRGRNVDKIKFMVRVNDAK